jgi:hypothetical protein
MFNLFVSLVCACEKNVGGGGVRSAVQLARLPRLPHIYQPLLAAVLVVHPEIVLFSQSVIGTFDLHVE